MFIVSLIHPSPPRLLHDSSARPPKKVPSFSLTKARKGRGRGHRAVERVGEAEFRWSLGRECVYGIGHMASWSDGFRARLDST